MTTTAILPEKTAKPQSLLEWSGVWTVAECRPQHWRAAQRDIEESGEAYAFVPTIQQRRVYQGKRRIFDVPLWPGYVFANLLKFNYDCTRDAFGVYALVDVYDQSRLARELENIRLAIECDSVRSSFVGVIKGDRVRVRYPHPMGGIEGIISKVEGEDRFMLECSLLGRVVPVEIDACHLELI
jgi:transcription antitermination factor NusG